jgi:hypothetical protein
VIHRSAVDGKLASNGLAKGFYSVLSLAADRYRFQFDIIASYLTGFLVSNVGFAPMVTDPVTSVFAVFGLCDRILAAVKVAASSVIAANPVIVCFIMENSVQLS